MHDDRVAAAQWTTEARKVKWNEVRYWCESLGCSEAQWRESVRAVGNSPENVREFLKTLSARDAF